MREPLSAALSFLPDRYRPGTLKGAPLPAGISDHSTRYKANVAKTRLDTLLVERALAPSRARAQALILAGRVLVDEQKIEKPGAPVSPEAKLRLLGAPQRYVSRGGEKLEAALAHWQISVDGRRCADIGASTGGFTDCMLQHGAAHVTAVDTGYGQIAQSLRSDPRVTLLERTNARHLAPGSLPGISFFAMDVAFISATLVLPAVVAAIRVFDSASPAAKGPYFKGPHFDEAKSSSEAEAELISGHMRYRPSRALVQDPGSTAALLGAPSGSGEAAALEAVILVKPQFEAGRENVGKGGIVRDPAAHALAIDRVRQAVAALGSSTTDVIPSPILGAEGNREFLLYARLPSGAAGAGA
jgi:23S rRNA (cytidine1920-2'-O)/16S rRNA (cytidine1409-2'-O)-methyltransferase